MHDCIQRLIAEDACDPHDISQVDIDAFIDKLDPNIWKAVCLLTQPKSAQQASTEATTVRRTRQFFCTCALLFCSNSQCSFPIHTLLTDIIESCGGSTRLIKIINRLGICASADTNSRCIQYGVKKLEQQGIHSSYPRNTFTVASADNLDFIHSYVRV